MSFQGTLVAELPSASVTNITFAAMPSYMSLQAPLLNEFSVTEGACEIFFSRVHFDMFVQFTLICKCSLTNVAHFELFFARMKFQMKVEVFSSPELFVTNVAHKDAFLHLHIELDRSPPRQNSSHLSIVLFWQIVAYSVASNKCLSWKRVLKYYLLEETTVLKSTLAKYNFMHIFLVMTLSIVFER